MTAAAAYDIPADWTLPLTNFEEFLRADNLPDYPMEFWLRISLAGPIDVERWSQSFWTLVATQPFLTARLRAAQAGGWELTAGAATPCMLNFGPAPPRHVASPIDLEQQPGLRCWVDNTCEPTRITLQCQHVISDAVGVLGWLALVAQHYKAAQPAPPVSVTPAQLQVRDGQPQSVWQRCLHGPYDILGSAGLIEYISHQPATLVPARAGTEISTQLLEQPETELGFTLTEEETARLQATAKRFKVTVNDLLAAALFRVLHARLKADAPREALRPLRIIIPKSLRDPADLHWLVANQVGMLFLDRRPGWFSDRWLLWTVQLELTLCKRWHAGRTFVRILDWSQRWFGTLRWLQPTHRATTTAVQSNLGDAWRLIDWPRDHAAVSPVLLEFWPPVRPFTAVSLGIAKTNGQLTVMFNWDRHRLPASVAGELVDHYRKELDRWTRIDTEPTSGHC